MRFGAIGSNKWKDKVIEADDKQFKFGWPGLIGAGHTAQATHLHITGAICPLDCTVSQLGIVLANNTGTKPFVLGIYADNGAGYAGSLIAQTDEITVSGSLETGQMILASLREEVNLTKGKYWLAFWPEFSTGVEIANSNPASGQQKYAALAYTGELPLTMPPETGTSGGQHPITAW
jgi:hypothetical protein